MKCDNCIHKEVCKKKPPESYPQFMIDIMTDKCENYIHTAYVQPVKHGRWIINSDGYYPQCSECMNEPQGRIMTNFCPNCGAKMDGDRDD